MSFGSDFLKGFFGSDFLKDYKHASKTFRANGYELAPKYKFLFYVKFSLNTAGIPALRQLFPSGASNELGLAVKTADLPSYQFDVETMNQYNRKRLVQTKINYDPVNITFHDDGSNLITNLWYNYFSYYYKDPSHKYQNVATGNDGALLQGRADYNSRDTYIAYRDQNDWGYVGESYSDATDGSGLPSGGKPRFFNDITIYGLDQHKFAQYTLINPIITTWKHDTYDYSEQGGTMEHSMQIQYETVKYYSGNLSGETPDSIVKGFADPAHYDTSKSPLARPGSTGSILGPGGLLDAAETITGAIADPSLKNILGAIQAGGSARETLKNTSLKEIISSEGNQVLRDVIRNQGPSATETIINKADGVLFPKETGTTNANAGQTNSPLKAGGEITAPATGSPTIKGTWT